MSAEPLVLLKPPRPHLAAAMRVVFGEPAAKVAEWLRWSGGVAFRFEDGERQDGDVRDAAEAWELLAANGVIPLAWVDDERRLFDWSEPCQHPRREAADDPCLDCGGSGRYVVACGRPRTVRDAVALASDPAGVALAEALAGEVVKRLASWGAPRPARVVWRVVGLDWYWTRIMPTWQLLNRIGDGGPVKSTRPQFDRHDAALRAANPLVPERTRGAIANALCYVENWRAAAPSPFAPLLDLWRAGYMLEALDDAAVTLVCPALGAFGS